MNITNNDYNTLSSAITLLKDLNDNSTRKSADNDKIVTSAVSVMDGLKAKKEKDNRRIAAYIADKRKDNKNYARGFKYDTNK